MTVDGAFVKEVKLLALEDGAGRRGYPWDLPALEAGLALSASVTNLIGENGSGKSTLLAIRLVRGARRPRTDFFLRAESLFTAATYLENLEGNPLGAYGGRSLHEQSHGESFLAVMINRFGPDGFYLLDEPEARASRPARPRDGASWTSRPTPCPSEN